MGAGWRNDAAGGSGPAVACWSRDPRVGSDGQDGGWRRRAPRGSLGGARIRAVRIAAGRTRPGCGRAASIASSVGHDGAGRRSPQRASRSPSTCRRISTERIDAGDLGELLRLAGPQIASFRASRSTSRCCPRCSGTPGPRRPAATAGRRILVIPGGLDPGVELRHRRTRVRTPYRREPAERSLGCERLRARAVGDLASVCSRAPPGRPFPVTKARTTGSTRARRSPRRTARSRSLAASIPWARLPLVVESSFAPDAGAEAAALADVSGPGRAPRRPTWTAAHRPGSRTQRECGHAALKTAAALPVKILAPWPYALVVHDPSKRDNFLLSGPGVDRRTGVLARGQVSWELDLKPGIYRYRSDTHAALQGSFRVSSAGAAKAIAPSNARSRPGSTAPSRPPSPAPPTQR